MNHKIYASAALIAAAISTNVYATPTQIEGATGGGLTPWAMLSEGKPTGSLTWVDTGDFNLTSLAINGTIMDRVELSYARQSLDVAGQYAAGVVRNLGHTDGNINVDVFGAKIKLMDMSDNLPQLAAGIQYKRTDLDKGVLNAIGSGDNSGTDVYLAATKVFDVGGKNLLLNGTLRGTKANQIGILGFGGRGAGNDDKYSLQFEGSAGLFATSNTMFGIEYRTKPDNLSGFREDNWWDVFVAYMPSKHWSVVGAYTNLGNIVAEASDLGAGSNVSEGEDQRGFYIQIQASF